MKLVVCALADLGAQAERHRPVRVISLLGPAQPAAALAHDPPRLVLRFNDIATAREGFTPPGPEMVAQLLAFAAETPPGGTLLLHCWMGVSRSPAAAFILACAQNPATPEARIAAALRRAAPSATPNPLLVRLADDHLARRGRMIAAISLIGRGCETSVGEPFEFEA